MKVFVVRLNPDTRRGRLYSKYPTRSEYEHIHSSSPMDGFHEAVNFLQENGVVRGYLPPKHLRSLRSVDPFVLVTITAKTASVGGDMVVGIQAGCRYEGENIRTSGTRASRSLELNWHYSCAESLSLLLPEQIPNARALILGKSGSWVRGPTTEISKATFLRVLSKARKAVATEEDIAKLERIAECLNGKFVREHLDIELESDFQGRVAMALERDLDGVVGNPFPNQVAVRSFRYPRIPEVVAVALKRAGGICNDCGNQGPFLSKTTGLPYLEVHHVKMLKDGGGDTVDNVVALCPNCHRKRHFG